MKVVNKKRKIVIIISIFVICTMGILFLFSFVFNLFWVDTSISLEQKYKDKMIGMISIDIPRLITFPSSKKTDQIGYFVFMFQSDYDVLINEIGDDIEKDLVALKQKYENVDEYRIDFESMTADIYCSNVFRDGSWFDDEELGISSCYDGEWYSELREVVNKQINNKCHQYYNLKYLSEPTYFGNTNLYAAKMKISAEGCVRIWSKGEILHQDGVDLRELPMPSDKEIEEIKQKAEENEKIRNVEKYNTEEINMLKDILSNSNEKNFIALNNSKKIRCTNEGYIEYLDLSDYSDLIGELDISGFQKLEYISLNGMMISEVILPESLGYIDEKSFADCANIKSVTIPKSVTTFTNPVFSGCKNLKEIVFEGNAPEVSLDKEDVFGKVPEDLVIYRKKSAKGWQEICWDKYDVRIIDE